MVKSCSLSLVSMISSVFIVTIVIIGEGVMILCISESTKIIKSTEISANGSLFQAIKF